MGYKSTFLQELRNLPYNIKTIFQWSKILWNNFDWDHRYLLDLIEYKLSRMKNYFEHSDFIVQEEYDKIIEQISIALNACHQLTSREFELELLEPHYEKYPFHFDDWIDSEGRKCHGILPMGAKEKEDWEKMNKAIDEKESEYKHQLFDTMRDYSDWWWD